MSSRPDTSPQPMSALHDAMLTAIRASTAVRGTTSPNPPVGCVILDAADRAVGVGATQPAGGPHAEVVALRAAGDRARGGTAVVTLEPCAHQGRTPACTEAILAAGIIRVVYAVSDPNPAAAGGADVLGSAGVVSRRGLLAEQVERGPLRAWLHFARTGRPHVTWKFAATLDGRSAAADGSSKWISSAESRADVHELRGMVDAIVAGTGTVLTDDPQLTARTPAGVLRSRQPLRVVVGTRDVPAAARVRDDAADTLVLSMTDPGEVLVALAGRGVVDVLLEGGPRLAGGFLAVGAVQRVLAYLAPTLLGAGSSALGDIGVSTLGGALHLDYEDVTRCGPDLRISATPRELPS